jgi:hypothetical protein
VAPRPPAQLIPAELVTAASGVATTRSIRDQAVQMLRAVSSVYLRARAQAVQE